MNAPRALGYSLVLGFVGASRWLFHAGAILLLIRLFGPEPDAWLIGFLLTSPLIAGVAALIYLIFYPPTSNTEPGGSPGTDENLK